jgi:hypothetical protein
LEDLINKIKSIKTLNPKAEEYVVYMAKESTFSI